MYPPYQGTTPFHPSAPSYGPPQDRDDHYHQRSSSRHRHRSYSPEDFDGPSSRPPLPPRIESVRREEDPYYSSDSSVPESSSHSAANAPDHPLRRVKMKRQNPDIVLTPSDAYLTRTLEESHLLPTPQPAKDRMLLIMDLNNCILFRRERTARGSRVPLPRPYLSTFLEYVCGWEKNALGGAEGRSKRFTTSVYSSARSYNVVNMLAALNMVPFSRAEEHPKSEAWVARTGEVLEMVFTREMMGLNPREFDQNVETVKDLDVMWKKFSGKWGPERTVLLDDEKFKASLQPHNHLPIEPFFVENRCFVPTPPSSPVRHESPTLQPSRPRIAPNSPKITPSSPKINPSRRSESPAIPAPPLQPALPRTQGLPHDDALLSTIYFLSVLRQQSNVSSFIREGGLSKIIEDVGKDKLVEKGIEICKQEEIVVREEWNSEWWKSCVKGGGW
ncbi:hypothetical protein T439DRAFT_320207 [Meredithblackwellia eburnea MCA 4105]